MSLVASVVPAVSEEFTGSLNLDVWNRDGRSVVRHQAHSGALRALRPHYLDGSGQVSVTAINPGGGYLGGDRYQLGAVLGENASLLLTTQSATKIYRTPQGPVKSTQEFTLGPGSRLESVPDGIIAYQDARYRQDTVIRMHPGASLVLAETVTHGWSPDGTPFAYEEVSLRTEVQVDGRLAVLDNLLLLPGQEGLGRLMLGGRSHLGTLLVVDPRADDDAVAALRDELGLLAAPSNAMPLSPATPLTGITRLAVPGFVLRTLADGTQAVETVLHQALNWMRARWHGQEPLDLRKR